MLYKIRKCIDEISEYYWSKCVDEDEESYEQKMMCESFEFIDIIEEKFKNEFIKNNHNSKIYKHIKNCVWLKGANNICIIKLKKWNKLHLINDREGVLVKFEKVDIGSSKITRLGILKKYRIAHNEITMTIHDGNTLSNVICELY